MIEQSKETIEAYQLRTTTKNPRQVKKFTAYRASCSRGELPYFGRSGSDHNCFYPNWAVTKTNGPNLYPGSPISVELNSF